VIVFLDGVEDPYNFGQSVRALYAAGIDGLVLRPRNWLSAAATVIRASAGATEFMPTAVAEPEEALAAARARGLPLAVADTEGARPMYEVDLAGPLFLVIGGEKRGVGRSVMNAADMRISIPYGRDFAHDLGTAGATAVLAFEVLRQRLLRRG
jgi:23S rRNA (guanosine2251-2'-O)-methyltransferase